MVIRINETNQQQYNDFFAEAFKYAIALKDQGKLTFDDNREIAAGAFTSLWQYFHYMPILAQHNPTYYTKLPLDEKMVTIDADSRVLDVPPQLQKCAGVENDHLAESIMFIVDRFHDGMDLMNAQVYIQWTATEIVDGEPVKIEKTTSVPRDQMDYNFAQNKIRFPWILNSDVTKYPGTISFSAVFFMTGNVTIPDPNDASKTVTTTGVTYRYSTLPSTIKIEPALQKDISTAPIDAGGLFASAVISNEYGPGFYVPAHPHFSQHGLDLIEISNLSYETLKDIGELTLKAQATAGDSGQVSYVWKYKAPDTQINQGIEFECGQNIECEIPQGTILTEKEVLFLNSYKTSPASAITTTSAKDSKLTVKYNFGRTYIKREKVKGNEINYFDKYFASDDMSDTTILTSSAAKEAIKDSYDERNLYEEYTCLELPHSSAENEPVTGRYCVFAINSISSTDTSNAKSSKTRSTVTTLESPVKPTFNETTNAIETKIINTSKKVELNPGLNTRDGEIYSVVMKSTTTNPNVDGNISYPDSATDYNSSNINSAFDENNNRIEISNATPGWYRATVTAKRNREDKNEVTKIWRLVNPVSLPTLYPTAKNTYTVSGIGDQVIYQKEIENEEDASKSYALTVGADTGDGTILNLESYYTREGFITGLESDERTYAWYKKTPSSSWTLIKDEKSYSITIRGPIERWTQYKCEVTNFINIDGATEQEKTATATILFELT